MNRFVLCIIAAISAAMLASAAPTACATVNPSDVSGVGFSYDCGGLLFSGFAVENAGNQLNGQVNVVGGTFEDLAGGRQVTLDLNPNLFLSSGGTADIHLYFTLSGGNAYQVDQVGAMVVDDGFLSETVCAGPTPSSPLNGACPVGDTLLSHIQAFGPSNGITWGSTFAPQSTVYIYKDIGGNAPIANTSVTQVYHLGNGNGVITGSEVPEPASILLIGTGLVGAGMISRKRSRA